MNKLFYGDNIEVLRERIAAGSVDLVYLDPPFNSNRNYNVLFGRNVTHPLSDDAAQIQAFGDTWVWTTETDQQFEALIAGSVPVKVADALTAMRTLIGQNDAMAYLVNMAPRHREEATPYFRCGNRGYLSSIGDSPGHPRCPGPL